MGPRSLNRGNEWSGEAAFETAPLQWGRGLSTAEITWHTHTDRISAGFNGAADSPLLRYTGWNAVDEIEGGLQWGRGLSAAEMNGLVRPHLKRHRFNGAAVSQPRK